MQIKWTAKALSDLTRLHAFLASVNTTAAAQVVQALVAAPARLGIHPRLGERLDEFEPREVRRILVGNYEMRYGLLNRRSLFCDYGMRGRIVSPFPKPCVPRRAATRNEPLAKVSASA